MSYRIGPIPQYLTIISCAVLRFPPRLVVRGCSCSQAATIEQALETHIAPSNGEIAGRSGMPAPLDGAAGSRQEHATSSEETERNDHLSRKFVLYLQTVSIVEALVESVPQIILQVRVGFFGGQLTQWVFVLSVSLSASCVLKAIGTFLWNYGDIRDVLASLQKQYVIRFLVQPAASRAPQDEGWGIATTAEARDISQTY